MSSPTASTPQDQPSSAHTLTELAAITSGAGMWESTELPGEIRALVLSDGPHGVRRQPQAGGDNLGIGNSLPATCFPPAVALGSSWNRRLITRIGEALGTEARALGVDVLLGPGLNIKRSPLGGRNFEYLSEDPYVSGRLAGAMVTGIQSRGVAATPKHFAVNNQETDRMRVDAQVDEVTLREIYLRGFEIVVTEHHPWAIMTSYNKVNGTYASEHPWLLTEVLRDEWGFDGLVMSDWSAISDRVAAVAAGCDLEMPPTHTDEVIVGAVRAGELDIAALELVRERLKTLADRTEPSEDTPTEIPWDTHHDLAREAAGESIILLQNNGALPLQPDTLQRIAVIGEFATNPRIQAGGSSRVNPARLVTPLDALREAIGSEVEITAVQGYSATGDSDRQTQRRLHDEALTSIAGADVAIIFLAQPRGSESEGFDRSHLRLPEAQLELLHDIAATSTQLIAVLGGGGVLELDEVTSSSDAVLASWLLGQAGGGAIADVLTGTVNPSGRLSETIPHRLEDNSSYLHFPGRERRVIHGEGRYVGYRSYDALNAPVAFPFGFGLGYTTFTLSDLAINQTGPLSWEVDVAVTNTGAASGAHVVQLYLTGPARAGEIAVHELRGFDKIHLEPGETTTVTLPLVRRDLARWNITEQQWIVEPGKYTIEVGSHSRDLPLLAHLETDGDTYLSAIDEWSTVAEWAANPLGAELIEEIRAKLPEHFAAEAEELKGMLLQLPMVKFSTWPIGPEQSRIQHIVARVAARRTGLARDDED